MANMTKTQDAIFSYMKEGRDQRDKMIQGFSTLAEKVEQASQYQQTCDTDRKEHNTRLTSLETSRTRQYGIAAGISFVITSIGGLIALFHNKS